MGVPGGEAWWLPEGQSAVVSVSVSMSVSRSVCIGVRVGVQPGDLQHSLPHSAALSAFPFKHHLPTLALPPPPDTWGNRPAPDEVTHTNEQ